MHPLHPLHCGTGMTGLSSTQGMHLFNAAIICLGEGAAWEQVPWASVCAYFARKQLCMGTAVLFHKPAQPKCFLDLRALPFLFLPRKKVERALSERAAFWISLHPSPTCARCSTCSLASTPRTPPHATPPSARRRTARPRGQQWHSLRPRWMSLG